MEQATRLQNQIERAREETAEGCKEGALKDYNIEIPVKINDITTPLKFSFTHETVIEHIDTFSDYVGQCVSDAVEKAIVNSIKAQHE